MGPYKALAVGRCSSADTVDGAPLGAKLLYLEFSSEMLGAEARRRVSVQRCKPRSNPHDRGDMPKYLPAGWTQYVRKNFSKKFPLHHVTQDDVRVPPQRWKVLPTAPPVKIKVGTLCSPC